MGGDPVAVRRGNVPPASWALDVPCISLHTYCTAVVACGFSLLSSSGTPPIPAVPLTGLLLFPGLLLLQLALPVCQSQVGNSLRLLVDKGIIPETPEEMMVTARQLAPSGRGWDIDG